MPRPYDQRNWRRLSRIKLQRSPLCEICERAGRFVPAVLVDHIKAINDGGDVYPRLDELMSMCTACHNMKHAGGIKGCDVDGMPIDPNHPWNR
jgi:5-methylcytosine-specific restriction protein A